MIKVSPRKTLIEAAELSDFIASRRTRRSNGPVNDDGLEDTGPTVKASAEVGGGVERA